VAANVLSDVARCSDEPLVVLFHTWPRPTVEGAALVIDTMLRRGNKFITVADLTERERKAVPPPQATSR
jgi:hypothetical protein